MSRSAAFAFLLLLIPLLLLWHRKDSSDAARSNLTLSQPHISKSVVSAEASPVTPASQPPPRRVDSQGAVDPAPATSWGQPQMEQIASLSPGDSFTLDLPRGLRAAAVIRNLQRDPTAGLVLRVD